MRQFIRHPVSIPIIWEFPESAPAVYESSNVGIGGLTFSCTRPFKAGTSLRLRIDCVNPPFETQARVAWCHSQENGFELGVEFMSEDDAYRVRMVEQICHIEDYRRQVDRLEGRKLSMREAAEEWISRYAPGFPNPGVQ